MFAFFCDDNMLCSQMKFRAITHLWENRVCIWQTQMPTHQFNKVCIQISLFPPLTFLSIQMVLYEIIEVLCINFCVCMECFSTFCFANVQKILGQRFCTKNMHNRAEHPADFIWIAKKLFSLTLYLFYV